MGSKSYARQAINRESEAVSSGPRKKAETAGFLQRIAQSPAGMAIHRAIRGLLRSPEAGPTLEAFQAPERVEHSLENSTGTGQPLAAPVRRQMESAFGTSFADVNVHTDGAADQMSQQIGAKAFTHNRDIYFSQGSYSPTSSDGQHVLAHELTHVVQQRSAPKLVVGSAYDPAEAEADSVADQVVSRLGDESSSPAVHRQESLPEEESLEPLRRQPMEEEEEELQTLRRQPMEEEEEELQALRRQPLEEEEEEMQALRRQPLEEEEEEAQPLRRQEEEEAQLTRDR